MTGRRIGFVGVAHSHPFTDAELLAEAGAVVVGVVDRVDPVRAIAFAERTGARICRTVDALVDAGVDLVVATPRTSDLPRALEELLARGRPVFANKVVAASEAAVRRLDSIASRGSFGTCSVLRYAPELSAVATSIRDRRPTGIRVAVGHDLTGFVGSGWQDDPADAGGTVVNVGIHAWEMVNAVLPGARLTGGHGEVAIDRSRSASELSGWLQGTVHWQGHPLHVEVVIDGTVPRQHFDLRVDRAGADPLRIMLGRRGDALERLGFRGLARAVLDGAREGLSPAPWAESRIVVANCVEAAARMRSGA